MRRLSCTTMPGILFCSSMSEFFRILLLKGRIMFIESRYNHPTGFYHEPNGGWYYSSKDGVYYKFEDGNYVPLESNMVEESDAHQCEGSSSVYPVQDESSSHSCAGGYEKLFVKGDGQDIIGVAQDNSFSGSLCAESPTPQNPPPPSEWLEDTLIELYLSNYSKSGADASEDAAKSVEACNRTDVNLLSNEESEDYELEEGEWIPEDDYNPSDSIGNTLSEGFNEDEENWRAQYGQVTQVREELVVDFPVVDLWDWSMVRGAGKDGKVQVARLVGRPVKQTVKLHPSVPAGGGLLKTAPICQVSFDLVRVRTGQVYKLRSPSARYLASLSSYDSSNPTKDWGFPDFSVDDHSLPLSKSRKNSKLKLADEAGTNIMLDQLLGSEKHKEQRYRDRAAERRTLHGGFSFGPGQKNSLSNADDAQSSPPSVSTEEAAAEAMNMTFGAGSYARKVLENMGWKEGEALGSSTKGLLEPIRAVGNVGSAGLGWPQRAKHK
ncbi:uncharacterized protein LOC116187712 isoform X1 [Punica granatum]|uniref:Uncharacterized protein LOC116187712 isoform X1 n=1 Tax=Punica granatum TaxID=22663 RepID=A0A6P8BQ69_PUNGR|nr:uncharacterized protein LOC116187712 isoform X1 [Punica granatum]